MKPIGFQSAYRTVSGTPRDRCDYCGCDLPEQVSAARCRCGMYLCGCCSLDHNCMEACLDAMLYESKRMNAVVDGLIRDINKGDR